jgi:HSP20 family protein
MQMLLNRNRFMTDMFDLVRRDMETLMGGAVNRLTDVTAATPAVNVWELSDAVVVEMELPGVTHEKLDIQVLNDELSVRGTRGDSLPEGAVMHRRERRTGEFARVVKLPFPVSGEQVEATLRDGVLQVRLPKTPEAMPRRIEVKTA